MYLPIQAETYNLSFGTDLKVSPTVGTLSKIPRVKIKKKNIPALTFLSKWLGKINPVIQPPKKKKKCIQWWGWGWGLGLGLGWADIFVWADVDGVKFSKSYDITTCAREFPRIIPAIYLFVISFDYFQNYTI